MPRATGDSRMMRWLVAVSVLMLAALAANAADPPSGSSPSITGLFLTTKYPSLTVRAGETTTVDLSLRNYKLPPQVLNLSVPEIAQGWKATILGGGQPVSAVDVPPDGEERLQLRLRPPTGAGQGDNRSTP